MPLQKSGVTSLITPKATFGVWGVCSMKCVPLCLPLEQRVWRNFLKKSPEGNRFMKRFSKITILILIRSQQHYFLYLKSRFQIETVLSQDLESDCLEKRRFRIFSSRGKSRITKYNSCSQKSSFSY